MSKRWVNNSNLLSDLVPRVYTLVKLHVENILSQSSVQLCLTYDLAVLEIYLLMFNKNLVIVCLLPYMKKDRGTDHEFYS